MWNVAEAGECSDRLWIELSFEVGMDAQGPQLGTEHASSSELSDIERLFSKPVTREPCHTSLSIMDDKRKHADCPQKRGLDANSGDTLDQHFGIGMAAEIRPGPG